jgi:hypothetical protein
MTTFTQAVQSYLSAKSLLSASKDLDRILYARNELKKALHELTKIQEIETDPLRLELIETILKD